MSMKMHTTEQNMTTVEDGHSTADDRETHDENRREIQTQQHSKLINLIESEHILQIRDSSGHEEQHSRSFHETPRRIWPVVRTWVLLIGGPNSEDQ